MRSSASPPVSCSWPFQELRWQAGLLVLRRSPLLLLKLPEFLLLQALLRPFEFSQRRLRLDVAVRYFDRPSYDSLETLIPPLQSDGEIPSIENLALHSLVLLQLLDRGFERVLVSEESPYLPISSHSSFLPPSPLLPSFRPKSLAVKMITQTSALPCRLSASCKCSSGRYRRSPFPQGPSCPRPMARPSQPPPRRSRGPSEPFLG